MLLLNALKRQLLSSLFLGISLCAQSQEFAGCPEDSLCTKESGEQRSEWTQFFKNHKQSNNKVPFLKNLHRKTGLPVPTWWRSKKTSLLKSPHSILWDSPCSYHHQASNPYKFFIAETFIKNTHGEKVTLVTAGKTHSIALGEELMLDPLYIWHNSHTPTLYYVPRQELPLYLQGREIFLILDFEENYYGLKISSSGEWEVAALDTSSSFYNEHPRKEVPCPEKSKNFLKDKIKNYLKFYQSTVCYEIWDKQKKEKVLVQSFEACR